MSPYVPALPAAAVARYRAHQRLTMELLGYADEVWGKRPPMDLDAWYEKNVAQLVELTIIGQQRAVATAESYTAEVLDQQGTPVDPIATPVTDGLVGVASDGRTLDGLYYGAIAQVGQQTEAKGAQKAWADGLSKLHVYMQTQLSDASRAATSLSMVARPRTGYVRMINPPACSRCVILAGRFYRYNAAFRRHPGCDCAQIISLEDNTEDVRTDPVKYFNSLTAEQQDKTFTRAGAEAIRLGADMNQVVNVRRGAAGLDSAVGSTGRLQRQNVYGQDLFTSTEGVTRRGVAGKVIRARGRDPRTTPRLLPESILEIAESREDAIRLLANNGFMVERAGVPLSGPGSRTGLVPKVGKPVRPVADVPAAPTPPRRLTEDDGRALGSRVWRGYAESVDPVDRQAVRTYTGDTYEPINDYLRGITTRISDDHRDAITRVDRVIDNAPRVPENITVSRAIGADVFGLKEGSNISGLVGRTFQDNGYISTALQSTLKSVNRAEVELRLDVPSGTRGLYVSSHGKKDDNSLAVYGQIENELLLGRGIDYEITDAAIEDGRRILSAKLVRQRSSNDE